MTILVSEGTMKLQNMGRARPGMGHMWSDTNSNLGVGCRNKDLGARVVCGLVGLCEVVKYESKKEPEENMRI